MLGEVSSTMESESDEDLLFYMGMRDDDPDEARLAWEEFYRRHKLYIYKVCYKTCQLLPIHPSSLHELVKDLHSATFQKVYEVAEKYTPLDNGNQEHMRLQVLAWVGKIAKNILIDDYRADKGPKNIVSLEELNTDVPYNKETPELSLNTNLTVEAIDTLNEKEKTVLLLYYQWYEIGKENQRLPNGISQEIAKAIGSTKENVRQIHRRAKQKIKQYLEQHADFKLRR